VNALGVVVGVNVVSELDACVVDVDEVPTPEQFSFELADHRFRQSIVIAAGDRHVTDTNGVSKLSCFVIAVGTPVDMLVMTRL
jgi:hypothetical protein